MSPTREGIAYTTKRFGMLINTVYVSFQLMLPRVNTKRYNFHLVTGTMY